MRNCVNRWIAVLLAAVFVLQPCLALAEALPESAPYQPVLVVNEETGMLDWVCDGETITEDVYLSRHGMFIGGQRVDDQWQDVINLTGTLRLADGVQLHVAGMNFLTEVGSRIYGDVIFEDENPSAYGFGGEWTDDGKGHYVHTELNGSVFGTVSTAMPPKLSGEPSVAPDGEEIPWQCVSLTIWSSAYVDTLRIDGANDLFVYGHVGTIVMAYTMGEPQTFYQEGMLTINPGAYVERIVDEMTVCKDTGFVVAGARVDEISARNFNVWGEQGASFGSITLDREAEVSAIYGRFSQCTIDSLTIIGSDADLGGGSRVKEVNLTDASINQHSVVTYWWHRTWHGEQNYDYLDGFVVGESTEPAYIGSLNMTNSWAQLLDEVDRVIAKDSSVDMRGHVGTISLDSCYAGCTRDYTIREEDGSNYKQMMAAAQYYYGNNPPVADMIYSLNSEFCLTGSVGALIMEGSDRGLFMDPGAQIDLLYVKDKTVTNVNEHEGNEESIEIGAMILGGDSFETYASWRWVNVGAAAQLTDSEYWGLDANIGNLYLMNGQSENLMSDASVENKVVVPEPPKKVVTDFELEEGKHTIAKTSSEDQWFAVELEEYDTLTMKLIAEDGLGAMLINLPDGNSEYACSEGEAAGVQCITAQGGTAYIRLVGGVGEYKLEIDVEHAARVEYEVLSHNASYQKPGAGQKTEYADYELIVSNMTAPNEEMWHVRRENEIIVPAVFAAPGDKLSIQAISLRGGWADGSTECKLSGSRQASVAIDSLEVGYYTVTCLDDGDVRIYLYGEDGAYCETLSYEGGAFRSSYLPEGKYRAVMIRGSAGMWRFTRLDDFAIFGLNEGDDYRMDSFTVKNGIISHYPDATVPDAPALAEEHFDMSKTSFRTNSATCAEGEMMLMSMSYALNEAYAAAEGTTLSLEFSDNLYMVDGSLLVNGELTDFEQEDGRVTLSLTGTSGELTWYAQCTEGAEAFALATMAIHMPGQDINACLGAASAMVCKLSFHVPDITSGEIDMFGKGPAGAQIIIYDGEERIAAATCDAGGYWYANYDFGEAEYYTSHVLKAEIASGKEAGAVARETVAHSADVPSVEHFTLYYYEHQYLRKIEVSGKDFGKEQLSYSYDPYQPFSFSVKMSANDQIEQLFITGKAGSETHRIEAKYDEATGEWIASGFFDPSNLDFITESIGVSYIGKDRPLGTFDVELEALADEVASLQTRLADNAWVEVNNEMFYGQEAEETLAMAEEGGYIRLDQRGSDTLPEDVLLYECDMNIAFGDEAFGETYHVEVSTCFYTNPEEVKLVSIEEGEITLYLPISVDGADNVSFNGLATGEFAMLASSGFADDWDQNLEDINQIIEEFRKILEVEDSDVLDGVSDFINDLTMIDDALQIKQLNDELSDIIDQANAGATAAFMCRACLPYFDAYNGISMQATGLINEMKDLVWQMYRGIVTDIAFKALKVLKWGEKIKIDPKSKLGKLLDKYIHLEKLPEFANEQLDNILDKLQEQLDNINPDIGEELKRIGVEAQTLWNNLHDLDTALAKCIEENCKPEPDDIDDNPTNPGIDPSGYVFEAVESNRIEGVTTVCYYQDAEGNMAFWNASRFGQKNPLTTDSNGYYEWFVPVGQWKVTYEKEGYEYAESEWLPVPPPQTEVNQAMVSYETPYVTDFRFYGDSCLVTFSRYMRIESIYDGSLSLSCGAFTAEPVNAEALYDGSGMAATVFRLTLAEPCADEGVELYINAGAVSYADVSANDETRYAPFTCEVQAIEMPASVNVLQGQTIELSGCISAGEGVENVSIECISAMDDLCAVTEISSVAEDGSFTVTIEARRASSVRISVRCEGSMAAGETLVNVLNVDPIDPVIPQGEFMQIVLEDRNMTTALYAKAAENSGAIFDDLMDGFMVRSISMSEDGLWHEVEYMEKRGWMPAQLLETVDLTGAIGRIADDTMRVSTRESLNINLWTSPCKDESMAKVKVGDTVTVLCAVAGTDWYYACKDGVYGYVNGRYLK